MIGIALLAVLLMLAMPAFTRMLQNAKLRGVAESILAGVQAARAEALKRNQTVEFMLTADEPDPANVAALAANAAGPNWVVRLVPSAAEEDFIEGRSGQEGSVQASVTVQVAAAYPGGATTIQFDGLGRAANLGAASAVFAVTNPAGGACKTAGGDEPMRCLNIVVTPGGRVRMCDPSVAGPDTRAC
jgi:type IV fimbrial biogenesis protein FimT